MAPLSTVVLAFKKNKEGICLRVLLVLSLKVSFETVCNENENGFNNNIQEGHWISNLPS